MYFNNPNQNGNFLSRFGNMQNFNRQLNSFKQQMDQQGNTNYEQMVQQLIDSGKMSQEQFNYYRAIANHITGKNL